MATKNALLSLSSGVNQKYIFQVIKVTKISDKIVRLTLSDGNAYISADTQISKLPQMINQYSLIKVELKYYGLGYPVYKEIKTLEIVQRSYKFLIGKPIPFVDYINQGFRSEEFEVNYEEDQGKTQIVQKPKYFRETQQDKTHIINVEENQNNIPYFMSNQDIDPYVPLNELEPKMHSWKILGRVSWIDHKMIQVKAGAKAGQKVLVLNFFIMDRYSKEIKCSCFDQAALKFQYTLKKNHIYEFSNGKIYEQAQFNSNRKFMNIRFQVFSNIVQVENPRYSIPTHSYNITSFDKLFSLGQDQQLDVGGIVKLIVKKQETNSNKLKMSIILADPILQKQIDVLLYLEPQQAMGVIQSNPLVLKNVKIVTAQQGTISLKSCFNSHYITKLQPEEDLMKVLQPYINKDIQKQQYQSLSKINYQLRNLNQHLQALELCAGQQKIFSKVNCYFMAPFGQKKYYYQACVKCFKKVNSVNKRTNFCEKCRKIVEVKEQYLLKCQFVDSFKHIKLTLVGDFAKAILKIEAPDFVKMNIDEQSQFMNSLKFTEVCLYLKSWKVKQAFNHNVQIIQKPHFDNLIKIQKILAGVKEQ